MIVGRRVGRARVGNSAEQPWQAATLREAAKQSRHNSRSRVVATSVPPAIFCLRIGQYLYMGVYSPGLYTPPGVNRVGTSREFFRVSADRRWARAGGTARAVFPGGAGQFRPPPIARSPWAAESRSLWLTKLALFFLSFPRCRRRPRLAVSALASADAVASPAANSAPDTTPSSRAG